MVSAFSRSTAENLASFSDEEIGLLETVVIHGDLAALEPAARVTYYHLMCRITKTNPANRPFEYLELDGKLTLYVTKRGTDEIRNANGVSVALTKAERQDTIYIVTAQATMPDGRTDMSTGAVPVVEQGLELDERGNKIWLKSSGGKSYPKRSERWTAMNPVDYANAVMKAETKAKRRVTLSAVGLGMLDESELDTVPRANRIRVNEDGEIMDRREAAPQNTHRAAQGRPVAIGSGHAQHADDLLPLHRDEPVAIDRRRQPQAAQSAHKGRPEPTGADEVERARVNWNNRLHAVAKAAEWTPDDLAAYANDQYQIESLADLSAEQIREIHDDIRTGLQDNPDGLRTVRDELRAVEIAGVAQ